MSNFAVLLLCIQACLVQNTFGQLIGACGGPALGIAPAVGIGPVHGGVLGACGGAIGHAHIDAIAPTAAYGGAGEGNVAVAGELPVAGNTAIAGTVPIMGAVNFGGAVPAAGAVSISGKCACGCGAPLIY